MILDIETKRCHIGILKLTLQTLYGLQISLACGANSASASASATVLALVAPEVGAVATRQDWPRRRLLEREKLAPAAPGASRAS